LPFGGKRHQRGLQERGDQHRSKYYRTGLEKEVLHSSKRKGPYSWKKVEAEET